MVAVEIETDAKELDSTRKSIYKKVRRDDREEEKKDAGIHYLDCNTFLL